MGATPTTENIPAEIVDAGLSGMFAAGTLAIKALINSFFPYETIPVLSQLIDYGINKIQRAIFVWIATKTNFFIIEFEEKIELWKFHAQGGVLQAAIASGNQEAIVKAKADFDKAIDSLGHSDGSAHA